MGIEGHNKLESFGFWRRKFCIKNAEILSVGKIAEFAKFAGGKRRKSPDRFSLYILAEGGDIVDGRIVDFMLECSGAERRQKSNSPIPYAHWGKSSGGFSG